MLIYLYFVDWFSPRYPISSHSWGVGGCFICWVGFWALHNSFLELQPTPHPSGIQMCHARIALALIRCVICCINELMPVNRFILLELIVEIKKIIINFLFQDIPKYLEKCRFLPKLNNELPDERNSTYKERFSSLENLVLIMVSWKSFFSLAITLLVLRLLFSLLNLCRFSCSRIFIFATLSYWFLNSLSRTLFWYLKKPPGLDITQTGPLNQFCLHNRYCIWKINFGDWCYNSS